MLKYRGSSKDVHLEGDAMVFDFTDRYSVFDWGEMPDQLEGKGAALAAVGALFFELLGQKGVPHHYLGLEGDRGHTRRMRVRPVEVLWPRQDREGWDYSAYVARPTGCLLPLEVIFRWGAPEGSSLLKRCPELKPGTRFQRPVVEFTTKLEPEDRFLTYAEAQLLAGLSEVEMARLIDRTTEVAIHMRDVLELVSCGLWDGKLEWAFHGATREFMLVDAIGLDEIRVDFRGQALSKEFLRRHYRGSRWECALGEAKARARAGAGDFKALCSLVPEPLPVGVKTAAQTLYTSFANDLHRAVTGTALYPEHVNLAHWAREHA
jgi:phosphoribosylaminoimidazole-succinocarboxamide synthase